MPEMIGDAMKTPAVDFADTEPSERILLENLPAYVVILSSDARVEYINRAGPGCHMRDVIGRSLYDLLSKKSSETATKCIQSALREGATSECEVVDVNGLIYLARCSPMANGEAQSSVLVVATDITSRKRGEAEIRQSEQKYRELVENIHDVIFSVDREGVLTFISPAIAAISGYQPSELVGRPYRDLVHPDDCAEVRAGFGAMLEGMGEPSEYRMMSKHGQYRWVRSHSRPISVDNVVVGVQGVLSDVTERRRTEGAHREAEGRYRSMFENAVLGIYHSTPDGCFLDVNRSLVSMLGYDSAEELTAMDIADALYVDPNGREKLVERIRSD